MKFSLVFDQSGDSIEFDVIYNGDMLQHFVAVSKAEDCNLFTDDAVIVDRVDRLLNDLSNCLSLTNSVLFDLIGTRFPETDNRLDYLDQRALNRQHAEWVRSQQADLDIDQLRFSDNPKISRLGWQLHDLYPDNIRTIKLAEAMAKLGLIFHYEEVNMTVHRLEHFFSMPIEFKAGKKWQIFPNPYLDSMTSNNDVVNFGFAYTYVGRQYYNKWQYFDSDLEFQDHYNYENLEFAFQLNLGRPQTVPFSKEFLEWCRIKQVPPVTTQIPIANAVDLEKNLRHYRTILYTNSRARNSTRIAIH